MKHSLAIREESRSGGAGDRKAWWKNFCTTTREEKFGPGLNFTSMAWMNLRADTLKKYGAWYDGTHVHFNTEQDMMWFLLRYS